MRNDTVNVLVRMRFKSMNFIEFIEFVDSQVACAFVRSCCISFSLLNKILILKRYF